jgi:uncharacterized membrane protein
MALTPALSLIAASFLLGSMVFFAAITAPAVFAFLPDDARGPYLRGIFPRYYAWGIAVAAIAAVLAVPADTVSAAILGIVTMAFLAVRQALLPRINLARKGRADGDEAAKAAFAKLHRLSVLINLAQMLALVGVIVLLAGG